MVRQETLALGRKGYGSTTEACEVEGKEGDQRIWIEVSQQQNSALVDIDTLGNKKYCGRVVIRCWEMNKHIIFAVDPES